MSPVMSRVDDSCHIWMSQVTCEWVTSRMNESRHVIITILCCLCQHDCHLSCHVWLSHVTYEWVMCDTTTSRNSDYVRCLRQFVTVMSRVNDSCQIWMSHVTCDWVMSRVNASCVTLPRHVIVTTCAASDNLYTRVMGLCHMWTSHMWHMNTSCRLYDSYGWHMNESCI